MATLTLLSSKVPLGYFSDYNIQCIQDEVRRILRLHFDADIILTRQSVEMVLLRVLEERLEDQFFMRQRAIMYLVNEYKTYSLEKEKHQKWEGQYVNSQLVWNPDSNVGPDMQTIKLSRQPSTMRFYFTF
jgi:hypothetical protein